MILAFRMCMITGKVIDTSYQCFDFTCNECRFFLFISCSVKIYFTSTSPHYKQLGRLAKLIITDKRSGGCYYRHRRAVVPLQRNFLCLEILSELKKQVYVSASKSINALVRIANGKNVFAFCQQV